MHELSLCRSIYAIVDGARCGRSVQTINIEVGQLRQVVPETLAYCWALATEDTPLAGSRLAIEHIPAELRCDDCRAQLQVRSPLLLACPACGSARTQVIRGDEMSITTMDVKQGSELVYG